MKELETLSKWLEERIGDKLSSFQGRRITLRFIRDEVGDKEKAFKEGRSWWEYELTVYRENVTLVFEWYLWGTIKDELHEVLERLGVEYDWKEGLDNTFDLGKVYLYKGDELVAEISWALEPR